MARLLPHQQKTKGCPCCQKEDTTKMVSTQYSFSEGMLPGWNLHKDFFPTNSPSHTVTNKGWMRESNSAEKLGRECFPFYVVNFLILRENGAKVAYPTKRLLGLYSSKDWPRTWAWRADGVWFCKYQALATVEVLEGHIHMWSAPQGEKAYIYPWKYTVTSKTHVLPSPVYQRWEI